jgi:hypothetical protein
MLLAICAFATEMTGVISDAKCGAAHEKKLNEACVKKCVGAGLAPVFVSDGKVYKIDDASKSKVMDHLGHQVKVNGNIEGDTITIESISMASGS